MFHRRNDDLDTARGIINGLILSAFIWVFIIGLIALLYGCATKPWTKGEIALGAAATAATVLDWAQTREIVRDPLRAENNMIMGREPSTKSVDAYHISALAIGALIAHYGPSVLAYILPEGWGKSIADAFRYMFLGGWAITETIVVKRNRDKGVEPKW